MGAARRGTRTTQAAAQAGETGRARTRTAAEPRRSVIMQARVEATFARTLLERDARVLGLDGASDLVREGLRLVHQRAQEQAMADSYDAFYGGKPAPPPTGVEAAGG